jgi:aminoglycoside phosphotransferase (APT) family kinase protein
LDIAGTAALIESQFPDLAPVRVAELGEGCDSVAFEINASIVFRFPKRADVAEQLINESRILSALAPTSPLPLPAFQFFGRASAAHPLPFVGYQKIPGQPAIYIDATHTPPLHLAPAIGRFLSWLHAYPVRDAEACGVPRASPDAVLNEAGADALDDLDAVAEIAPGAPLDAVRTYLRVTPPRSDASLVLVHNDLAAEHVLVDERGMQATGVIDWSDIAVGDAAVDVAGMFHWGGEAFAAAVLGSYSGRADPAFRTRARYLAVCRAIGDIVFGREFQRPEYIRAGLRALHLCHNPAP